MENTPWSAVTVPQALACARDLPAAARSLYAGLCLLADEKGQVRLTQGQLAEQTGLGHRDLIRTGVAALAEAGWLRITPGQGRQSAAYRLVRPQGAGRALRVPAQLVIAAGLRPSAKALYLALAALCEGDAPARLHREELVRHAAVGADNTVRAAVRQLAGAGWLATERLPRHAALAYRTLDPHRALREGRRDQTARLLDRAPHAGEAICKQMLDALVADRDYTDNGRPGKLDNPYTGERLEFDRFYWRAKVAFEFNGPQHDGPTDWFPDPDQARSQRGRDLMKAGLASEQSIRLIVVRPGDLSFARLRELSAGALPLRATPMQDPVVRLLHEIGQRYVRAVLRGKPLAPV